MAMLGKRRAVKRANQRDITEWACDFNKSAGEREGIEILRLAHDGRGVARDAAGKTLFIDQALPGERVRIAIHRSRKRYDEAHVRELLEVSEKRQTPHCGHYAQCGGCDLQHLALPDQRLHKQAVLVDQLARQGLALTEPPELLAGDGLGYRRRARIGVKVDTQGAVHLGFRARGSHHLVDIHRCPVLVSSLDRLLEPLRACLDELDAPRQVGHVELLAANEVEVVIVRQLRANPADATRWQAWAQQQKVVLGMLEGRDEPRLDWFGKAPSLNYTLKSGSYRLRLAFSPGDFLQVNADVNQMMVATALDWLQPAKEERVLDLFAGVGNFTLALAPHVAHVVGIEGSQAMVAELKANAEGNGLHQVEARQADLGRLPSLDPLPDIVVLDPPRGGAETVCRALANSQVSRILYVSCDPATLARDSAHLVHAGYRITRAAVADMFVQTAHLESMLLFERGKGQ